VQKRRSVVKCNWSDNFATLLEKAGSEFFYGIHIFLSFSSRPTDPKFLAGWPEKQQINLEWPNFETSVRANAKCHGRASLT